MLCRIGVAQRYLIVIVFSLASCVLLFDTLATAQVTIQPKDEIFGGYSWLGISGTADFNIPVQDIPVGFDASNTYYLPQAHNLGIIADGSGHFNTGRPGYTGVGFAMVGLQYKYHTNSFSPFVRFMVGAENDVENAKVVIDGSVSGQWLSPHYDDLVKVWLKGDYIAAPMDPDAVKKSAKYHLLLTP